MRSDRDKRTDNEREIDDFLAQFDTPVDELSADINSYLDAKDTTKLTAARTFYGAEFRNAGGNENIAPVSDVQSEESSVVSDQAEIADSTEDVSPASADEASEQTADKKPSKKKAKKKKGHSKPSDNKAAAELKAAGATVSAGAEKVAEKVRHIDKAAVKRELFFKKNKNFDPDKPESSGNKKYVFSIGKLFRDFVLLGVAMVLCFMIYALGCITFAPHIDPKDIYSSPLFHDLCSWLHYFCTSHRS